MNYPPSALYFSMQEFRADLHIHSRFSRATSSKLAIPLLAAWAGVKGLAVLGTGDFTHPQWRKELAETLYFEEASGLYRLTEEAASAASLALPDFPPAGPPARGRAEDTGGVPVHPVRFMLQGEISSIYKRGGKVRKVHNLVFMPTLEAAQRFSSRLEEIGNLHSDGRPILGLDSRHLLEMVLEADPGAFLVPAHIWTPWFSVFGSKSGFDSLEECFGDLTPEIFALETGLSSDPAMNRMWSALDPYRLISNSDAHSGENLGREANVFAGAVSYEGMLNALKHPAKPGDTTFLGTLEFYPEEGKYHMDGHRKCKVVLSPEETRELGGICPVCGGPVTVGVLSRVVELADRPEPLYPAGADWAGEKSFASLVPLTEILGEILGVGPKSRKVGAMYAKTLARFGSELDILQVVDERELARFFPPLGEAVGRMRRGEVSLAGGYDGEYGTVRVFSDQERREIQRGAGISPRRGKSSVQGLSLLEEKESAQGAPPPVHKEEAAVSSSARQTGEPVADDDGADDFLFSDAEPAADGMDDAKESPPLSVEDTGVPQAAAIPPFLLNASQEEAVLAGPGPVLVLAGPGTGKTRTLVSRILHLLDQGISSRNMLAVTFTRRAATEMDARLTEALGKGLSLPRTDTLHALALELWHRTHDTVPVLLSEESARQVFAEANSEETAQTLREGWQGINLARERLEMPLPEHTGMAERYFSLKAAWNLADYTDLLEFWLEQMRNKLFTVPWSDVLVDEVQDLSPLQLALVRSLVPSTGDGFFGIGDPDQSIYGFRGAHGKVRDFFTQAWPHTRVISLTHNYRSRPGVLLSASAVMGRDLVSGVQTPVRQEPAGLYLFEAPSAESEASWVAERVAALVGTGSHSLADASQGAHRLDSSIAGGSYSPGDIAILLRTRALARPLRKALARHGVPVAEPAADAFWADSRVELILRAAGRMLGIAVTDPELEKSLPVCPDRVLAKGPLATAAFLSTLPPFDQLFWNSTAWRSLVKAYDNHGGWAELITWINLQNELELVRARAEKVQILTIHAAKGLEFGAVFLPGLEDGILPFAGQELLTGKPDKGQGADMDEERRLFYVGLTRAKDALFLSRAGRRVLYGRELRLQPSRFLDALDSGGEHGWLRTTLKVRQERQAKQLNLL